MNNKKLIFTGLVNSLGVVCYTGAVAWLLFNGEKIFNRTDNFLMPVSMLLLLVISATITGALVLGKPIMLYLDNQKTDAIKLLAYTVSWIVIFATMILISLAVV